MLITDTADWAAFTFGQCNLGDKRRTMRLIKMSEQIASSIGQSIVKSCANTSEVEGAYRLIRNENVHPEAIAEGAFNATAQLAKQCKLLLALEDTTNVTFTHEVAQQLGYTSSSPQSRKGGFQVHSILMMDADSQKTIGLIEQNRWVRELEGFGKRKDKQKRGYKTKESFKWEQASKRLSERLGESINQTISVCDRESDIIEYLHYKSTHSQRFLVRTRANRPLANGSRLHDYLEQLKPAGSYTLEIPQRGGRKARKTTIEVAFAPVEVLAPERKQKQIPAIKSYAIICKEKGGRKDGLVWHLLTSEPVDSLEQAKTIVGYYEARWKIEEYHKAWKSGGTQVEKLRMQSAGNIERMAVILAFVAVRLLQLREIGVDKKQSKRKCTELLTTTQWKLLWAKVEKSKPRKNFTPSIGWAYETIGRLGGWNNSKNNGRIGWNSLWDGWMKLEMLVEGYELRTALDL